MMQKKSNDFKLPQLKRPAKEPEKTMSKTGIDSRGTARVRPASSTKVEDLEKKLFSKLDSYEGPSKKSALKRGVKSIKQIDNDSSTGTESTPEGYEKMQKLMPGLYKKFIEARREPLPFQSSLSSLKKIDTPFSESRQLTKKQEVLEKAAEKQEKEVGPFPTEVEDAGEGGAVGGEELEMTEEEMQVFFGDYLRKQNLELPEVWSKEMTQLGSSLVLCENEIQKLKESMESMSNLALQLGMNELEDMEEMEEDQ